MQPKFADIYPGLLLQNRFYLQDQVYTHKRKIYDIVALLGDLGGVTEVIMLVLGIILFPISESSYNMMSTKRMFLARTKDDKFFRDVDEEAKKKKFLADLPDGIRSRLKNEIQKHRIIRITLFDKLCYYMHNQIGCFFVCGFCCWPNKKKFLRLIDEAQDRLEAELDVVKIIQNLRNMKVLLKSSLMSDPGVQAKIAHSAKNFIDIDASSSSDDTDDSETTESSCSGIDLGDGPPDQEANPDTARPITGGN